MTAKLITEGAALEDSGILLRGRLEIDGQNAQQADLSEIAYTVFKGSEQAGAGTLTIADVIFDALQTGKGWKGAQGYNFSWAVPASLLADGGVTYRFEVKFTPAAAQPCHHIWTVRTTNLQRS